MSVAARALSAHPTSGALLLAAAGTVGAALAAFAVPEYRLLCAILAIGCGLAFLLVCRIHEVQDDALMDREWNLTEDILHHSWWAND